MRPTNVMKLGWVIRWISWRRKQRPQSLTQIILRKNPGGWHGPVWRLRCSRQRLFVVGDAGIGSTPAEGLIRALVVVQVLRLVAVSVIVISSVIGSFIFAHHLLEADEPSAATGCAVDAATGRQARRCVERDSTFSFVQVSLKFLQFQSKFVQPAGTKGNHLKSTNTQRTSLPNFTANKTFHVSDSRPLLTCKWTNPLHIWFYQRKWLRTKLIFWKLKKKFNLLQNLNLF